MKSIFSNINVDNLSLSQFDDRLEKVREEVSEMTSVLSGKSKGIKEKPNCDLRRGVYQRSTLKLSRNKLIPLINLKDFKESNHDTNVKQNLSESTKNNRNIVLNKLSSPMNNRKFKDNLFSLSKQPLSTSSYHSESTAISRNFFSFNTGNQVRIKKNRLTSQMLNSSSSHAQIQSEENYKKLKGSIMKTNVMIEKTKPLRYIDKSIDEDTKLEIMKEREKNRFYILESKKEPNLNKVHHSNFSKIISLNDKNVIKEGEKIEALSPIIAYRDRKKIKLKFGMTNTKFPNIKESKSLVKRIEDNKTSLYKFMNEKFTKNK